MDRWLVRLARVIGTTAGAFAGLVALQFMRLRRMEFLPGHPGFFIDHVVHPSPGSTDRTPLRLVVFGDSTTAGVGVQRAEDSLPHLLARRIADTERCPVHVVSYGWSGARAADLMATQLPRALEPLRVGEQPFLAGADVVALVVGANDATHHSSPARFRADLRASLSAIHAAAPGARVVLAGIPRFRGALRGIEPLIFLVDQYARLLRPIGRHEAGRAGAAYADLAGEVPRRIRGQAGVLSPDRFHPSVIGYSAWADVIFEALVGQDVHSGATAPWEPASA